MNGYSTSEVARLLDLSPSQVRGYVRAGVLSPDRDGRGELNFSFQDLVFLRTARGLMSSRVAPRRVRAALRKLASQLPDGHPITAVRVAVEGGRIVVDDGASRWQPESGQTLLDFGDGDDAGEVEPGPAVAPILRREPRDLPKKGTEFSAEDWYDSGCELEAGSPREAIGAYEKALDLDPAHADAHVNLGRLLHEAGDPGAAAPHYEAALASRPDDAVAAFNLGVALEDLRKFPEALLAYQRAVRLDPGNADGHFNAATLAERLGRPAEAVQHLRAYRELTRE